METEMEMMDHTMDEDMPVESTTGLSPEEEAMPLESTTGNAADEELMYTTSDGSEYQATIGDISYATDISDAQVAGLATLMGAYGIFMLVLLAVSIVAMWKIFTKANQAGWKSIIPIYNLYVMLQIIGRPGWWLLLFFVPLVNIVISIIISIDLAKSFGRSEVFGIVGLFLFSLVGYLILAFGKDVYVGPGGTKSSPAPESSTSEPAPPAAPAV